MGLKIGTLFLVALLLMCGHCVAQNPAEDDGSCASLAAGTQQSQALQQVCEFVRALPSTLPKYICNQTTRREMPTQATVDLKKASSKIVPPGSDIVTAQLTYSDGSESYDDVRVDGHPTTKQAVERSGFFWSTGELASYLNAVFAKHSKAHFDYQGTEVFEGRTAARFSFQVASENNIAWVIQVRDVEIYPGFRGQIWIDAATSELLRLHIQTDAMADNFPLKSLEHDVDYRRVALGDESSFILPVRAEMRFCRRDVDSCFHNVTEFQGYKKFASKSRMVVPGS